MASQLTTIAATALSRILAQYRKMVLTFVPLVEQLGEEVQELEDAAWGFYEGLQFENAEGDMLDRFGFIVGAPRESFSDDDDYRPLVEAKILANVSEGRIDDFNAVVAAAVNDNDAVITVIERPPMALEVKVDDVALVDPKRERLRRLVSQTRGTGVRVMLLTTTTGDETQDFCFAGGAGVGFRGLSPAAAGGKFRTARAAPK